MFESLRLRSVKRHLVLLFICHETSGFTLLPAKLPNACQAILTRIRSKVPGSSPFESDGMLVYGQPTTPDGRVEVKSESLAKALQRAGASPLEATSSTKGEEDRASTTSTAIRELGGRALKPRTVLVGSPNEGLNLTIWEVAAPQEMLEEWMYRGSDAADVSSPSSPRAGATTSGERSGADDLDPFGVVLWPGAQLIAARLLGQRAAGEVINQETSASGKSTASSSALQGESSGAVQIGRGAQQWAGKRVLCVGCGTGLEALAASVGGGASVVATDTNPLPLALLRLAAAKCDEWQPNKMSEKSSGSSGTLRTAFFDILNPANAAPEVLDEGKDSLNYDGPVFGASLDKSSEMITWGQGGGEDLLSSCDLLVAADCLYNKELADALAERCLTAWARGAAVLVADSQGFHRADFEAALGRGWAQAVTARARAQEQVMAISSSGTSEERYHRAKKKNAHAAESDQRPALKAVSMRVVGSGLLLEGDLDYTITVKLLALPGLTAEAA